MEWLKRGINRYSTTIVLSLFFTTLAAMSCGIVYSDFGTKASLIFGVVGTSFTCLCCTAVGVKVQSANEDDPEAQLSIYIDSPPGYNTLPPTPNSPPPRYSDVPTATQAHRTWRNSV